MFNATHGIWVAPSRICLLNDCAEPEWWGRQTNQAEWNVYAAFRWLAWNGGSTVSPVHALDWHKCMKKQSLLHQGS